MEKYRAIVTYDVNDICYGTDHCLYTTNIGLYSMIDEAKREIEEEYQVKIDTIKIVFLGSEE